MKISDKNKTVILICIAAVLLAAACVLREEPAIYKKRPIRFSHITHVKKENIKCSSCHRAYANEDSAGMPEPRMCRKCHQTEEEISKFLRPFAPEKKLVWSNIAEIKDEVLFSHKIHHDKKVECEQCHTDIMTRKEVFFGSRVEKEECIDCHAKEKISGECKTCHKIVNEKWEPPNHAQNWKIFHGQFARMGMEESHKNNCLYCHPQETCARCHQDEAPSDHTTFWRYRGHGVSAGMDRSRCFECHNNFSCVSCHRETSPRNHVGPWGNPQNRHCITCHFPLDEQGCGACHEDTQSHRFAPSLPIGVTHASAGYQECRTCHINNGTLRHYDKGDDCRLCHQ